MIYPFKMVIVQFATIKNNQGLFQTTNQFSGTSISFYIPGHQYGTWDHPSDLFPSRFSIPQYWQLHMLYIYICIHNEI